MKRLIQFTFFFVTGFLLHAFAFPNLFTDQFSTPSVVLGVNKDAVTDDSSNKDFLTYVTYRDGAFYPPRVVVKRGNYIAITNVNKDDPMWLQSNTKVFDTNRPFLESERLKMMVDIAGIHKIYNKLKPEAQLTITVP